MRPVVTGVVSEAVKSNQEEVTTKSINNDDYDNDDTNTSKDEDVFGEKFEIPAFLRKIH